MLRRTILTTFATLTLSFAFCVEVRAADLGPDCKPNGIVAVAQEAWNPKAFWTRQLKEIRDYVEGQKLSYRLSLIERKRNRVNETLDAEEMKAMGIPQISDPELERELARTDREIVALDRELLQGAIEWGQRCTTYARQKVSEAK